MSFLSGMQHEGSISFQTWQGKFWKKKKKKQGQIMAAKGIQLGAGSEDCIRGP